MNNITEREQLRWRKIHILDDGFVCLVDWMGDDSSIAQAARVSYGSESKSREDDVRLIQFLMKHKHMTPFEMAELKFLVRVPMDTWRQWVRHRTASINEQSSRYRVLDNAMATTEPGAWRKQSDTNRQGSGSPLPRDIGLRLSQKEATLHQKIYEAYQERIELGVAREQARKDLPLSTYTEAYWKIDLRNLLHFLELRLAPDSQQEIRSYAEALAQIVENLFPAVWSAFKVFRLNSVSFDQKELSVLKAVICSVNDIEAAIRNSGESDWFADGSRHRDELVRKLQSIAF